MAAEQKLPLLGLHLFCLAKLRLRWDQVEPVEQEQLLLADQMVLSGARPRLEVI